MHVRCSVRYFDQCTSGKLPTGNFKSLNAILENECAIVLEMERCGSHSA